MPSFNGMTIAFAALVASLGLTPSALFSGTKAQSAEPTAARQDGMPHSAVVARNFAVESPRAAERPSWTLKLPANRPPAKEGHAMAACEDGKVVMFGGNGGAGLLNDTWVWDGTDWTQMAPPVSPEPRAYHAMACSRYLGGVVLFGGLSLTNGALGDTWIWNGTQWNLAAPSKSPPARYWHAMAYHSGYDAVILFGGTGGGNYYNDTWIWDRGDWRAAATSSLATPSKRYSHTMTFDSVRGRVVLFGGGNNDTWLLLPNLADWIEESPANPPPSKGGYAMAFDEVRKEVVMFGGYDRKGWFPGTWIWNGLNWTIEFPARAPSTTRDRHALAYDRANQAIVLFGGLDDQSLPLNDTWVRESIIKHTIAGRITASGVGLAGVTVTLSGSGSGSVGN